MMDSPRRLGHRDRLLASGEIDFALIARRTSRRISSYPRRPMNRLTRDISYFPLGEPNRAQQSARRESLLQSQDSAGCRSRTIGALHFPEKRLQRRVFVPDGPSACESSGIISCHYPDWFGEARQPSFKLLIQKKRHSATRPINFLSHD